MINCLRKVGFVLMIVCIRNAVSSPPCGHGYGQTPCVLFVPAKPGQTPTCATPGSTFCEKINDYPENLIAKLLKNYQTKDLLTDEAKIDFNALKKQSLSSTQDFYGPPGYNYGPFDHAPNQYGPPHSNPYDNNFNENGQRLFNRQPNPAMHSNIKSNGYHYSNPGHSSSSTFFQSKPPSYHNYSDFYKRTSRKKRFDDPERNKMVIREEFLKSISPRTKRQTNVNREQLCEIRSSYINPQAALNSRGNWMYIVNGQETTQLVRTETCASTECSNLCQLPNGYNSRCEQKYVQKRLIALDARGEKLYTDTFWFPSCCVCTLSNI